MENKILVLNDKQEKIGETFVRRAKQLVNQQRAEWADDGRKAIRFFPDAEEEWEESAAAEAPVSKGGSRLFAIAEKRIQEKNLFVFHSVMITPGFVALFFIRYFLIYYTSFSWDDADAFFLFTSGGWTGMYLMHFYFFSKDSILGFFLSGREGREERRARKLMEEVERLKRMGYME